jgi:UDP-N-acetylmuramate--alanine ligase
MGEYLETPIISDYAHHPNEIKKSIEGLKERFYNPLIIFQPHTYSRTESLKDEFVESLNENDVIIYPTYPAREKYNSKGSAYNLFRRLKNKHKFYVKDIKNLKCTMQELMLKNNYDIVVILGAGDLYDKFNEIL